VLAESLGEQKKTCSKPRLPDPSLRSCFLQICLVAAFQFKGSGLVAIAEMHSFLSCRECHLSCAHHLDVVLFSSLLALYIPVSLSRSFRDLLSLTPFYESGVLSLERHSLDKGLLIRSQLFLKISWCVAHAHLTRLSPLALVNPPSPYQFHLVNGLNLYLYSLSLSVLYRQ
jgi:hypothetical protein